MADQKISQLPTITGANMADDDKFVLVDTSGDTTVATTRAEFFKSVPDVTFGDSDKAIFGAGSDLQIYHDGSNSWVRNFGIGSLYLAGDSDGDVIIQGKAGENSVACFADGATRIYNDGAEKLATTATGIDVTGVITTDGMTTSADINFGDNDKAIFGAGSDLQIYHDGSHSIIKDAGAGYLKLGLSDQGTAIQNTAGANLLVTDATDVSLRHNGDEKLATAATGIDVTGTVTADGLTVDTSDQVIINHSADGGGIRIDSTNATNTGSLRFGDVADNYIGALEYNHNVDAMTMYVNNAERMRIDSSGEVNISSVGNTNGARVNIGSDANNAFVRSYSTNSGMIVGTQTAQPLKINTNGSEAMRIDSSGNLLVGKTSAAGQSTAGIEARGDGVLIATKAGTVQYLNRTGSDGTILNFAKDGTTVGSIGSGYGAVDIKGGTSGLLMGNSAVLPVNGSGTLTDGSYDIGTGSFRFKDLYLSGGVYLGGTGAANKLDDYEEGTWTGTLTGSTGAPNTAQTTTGKYTKVGNTVTVVATFANKDVTGVTGDVQVTGLPFTYTGATGEAQLGFFVNNRGQSDQRAGYLQPSSTTLGQMNQIGSPLTWASTGGGVFVYLTITYITA